MERTAMVILILPKIPKRPPVMEDIVYLCYDADSPISWENKIFVVQDEQKRFWFCHELKKIALTEESLQRLADCLKEEYSPKTLKELQKRIDNPLVVQAVVSRALSLDELRSMLGAVQLPVAINREKP